MSYHESLARYETFCGSGLRENGALANGSDACHCEPALSQQPGVELMGCGATGAANRRVLVRLLRLDSGAVGAGGPRS